MKFMVFTAPTEEGLKNPPTADAYKAMADHLQRAVDTRSIEIAYHGKSRAIFIVETTSEDEVARLFDGVPLAYHTSTTIEPLEGFFDHTKRIHSNLTQREAGR